VLCFPPAGAGPGWFRPLARALPATPVYGIELPGHGTRLREPLLTTMAELIEELAPLLDQLAGAPYTLYGHSMGGLVAFEAARRLAAGPGPDPLLLAVSGCQPPRRRDRLPKRHRLPDDDLVAELVRLGSPAEPLAEPEIRRIALPILRADLTLAETWLPQPGKALPVPILALAGTADPDAPPADAGDWSAETAAGCTVVAIDGGHFFPESRPAEVASALQAALARTGSG
jgi:surfactin synthase thioesterase subunit